MSSQPFRILGIAGSLRRASFNRALLRVAIEEVPAGVTIEPFDIAPIPLYNEDLLSAAPEPVRQLKERLRAADALLIATPEYNYGVPGVLKNAIDWSSRPPRESAIRGKPTAIMGASPGRFGTVRSQHALRQVLMGCVTPVLLHPQVLVSEADRKFDAEGALTDPQIREFVRALVAALVEWARTLPR